MSQNANPSNLSGSLLEGNKDHMSRSGMIRLVEARTSRRLSLHECIGELQRQTEAQRLALQDAQYGFVESRREPARLQEELSMKKKFSETLKSETRTKWERF